MGDNKSYGSWIFAILITLYGWFLHSLLKKIVPFLFKSDDSKPQSSEYSSFLKGTDDDHIGSISEKFEEMCVNNPVEFKNDPELNRVIKDYGDLIKGRRLDPEGNHMPSLTLGSGDNPDYYRYLRNQKRALKSAKYDIDWITKEMSRVTDKNNSEVVETEFTKQLIDMGIPAEFIPYVMTYDRMENYTPKDWTALIKSINNAVKTELDPGAIMEFLDLELRAKYYSDPCYLEDYCTLRGSGSPKLIALEYSKDRLSEEQAFNCVALVQKGYSEEEAMLKVLEYSTSQMEAEDLRDLYRTKI